MVSRQKALSTGSAIIFALAASLTPVAGFAGDEVVILNAPKPPTPVATTASPAPAVAVAPTSAWSESPETLGDRGAASAVPAPAMTAVRGNDVAASIGFDPAPDPVQSAAPRPDFRALPDGMMTPARDSGRTRAANRNFATLRPPNGDSGSLLAAADRVPMAVQPAVMNHAEFNIIQCVANCIGPVGMVVFFAPRVSSQADEPVVAGGRPAAIDTALAEVAADSGVITCVAGCYSTPKSYVARPAPSSQQHAAAQSKLVPALDHAAALVPTSAVIQPSIVRTQRTARPPMRHRRVLRSFKLTPWNTVTKAPRDWRLAVVAASRHP